MQSYSNLVYKVMTLVTLCYPKRHKGGKDFYIERVKLKE